MKLNGKHPASNANPPLPPPSQTAILLAEMIRGGASPNMGG